MGLSMPDEKPKKLTEVQKQQEEFNDHLKLHKDNRKKVARTQAAGILADHVPQIAELHAEDPILHALNQYTAICIAAGAATGSQALLQMCGGATDDTAFTKMRDTYEADLKAYRSYLKELIAHSQDPAWWYRVPQEPVLSGKYETNIGE